jgi:hypothetical protein
MSSSCLLPFVLWLTKATSVTCRYLLRSWQGTWTGSRTEASPAHREQRRVPGQAGRGRVAAGVVGRECGRFGKYRAAALFATSLVSVRLRHAPFFCWSSERREGGTCGEVQGGMIRLRTIWVVYLSFHMSSPMQKAKHSYRACFSTVVRAIGPTKTERQSPSPANACVIT